MQRTRTPDGRFRYTYASAGMSEVFGIDPDAIVALGEADHSWVHPDDRQRFVAALHRSADTLQALDEEVRVLHPAGGCKWVRSIGTPRRLEDGTVVWDGIALDVTERRAAAEALERAVALARAAEAERWENERLAQAMQRSDQTALRKAVERLLAALPDPLSRGAEAEAVRRCLRDPGPTGSQGAEAAPRLTPRQRDVLALLSQGLSNREIGQRLALTEGTVKLHVAAIRKRLGAPNRTAAVIQAMALGR